jgi:hypothetical protein
MGPALLCRSAVQQLNRVFKGYAKAMRVPCSAEAINEEIYYYILWASRRRSRP